MVRSVMLSAVCLGVVLQAPTVVIQAPPPAVPQNAAPAAGLPRVIRISGGVAAKFRSSYIAPVYPIEAESEHLSGTVVLHVMIGKDGVVEKVAVASSTNPVFNDPAVEAVKQWHYRPYLLNGEPVTVDTVVLLNFAYRAP